MLVAILGLCVLVLVTPMTWDMHQDEPPDIPPAHTDHSIKVSTRIYFQMSLGGEDIGRIVIGLFGYDVPDNVAHYVRMATQTDPRHGGFLRTIVYDVIRDFWVRFGQEYSNGTRLPGDLMVMTDREGAVFENFGEGVVLSAYSKGFWITGFKATGSTRDVPFGRVIDGMDVVYAIQAVPLTNERRPKGGAVITACGELPLATGHVMYINKTKTMESYRDGAKAGVEAATRGREAWAPGGAGRGMGCAVLVHVGLSVAVLRWWLM